MIELVVSGVPYKNYTNASATFSVESMANDFSFTASAVDLFPPFKVGQSVEVFVNGIKRLTGYIEEASGSESEGSHTITYTGRDRTCDFIDSQVSRLDDLRGSLTLKRVIELLIKNIGADLKVIDLLNPSPLNIAEDLIDAKDGTNALDIAMQYALKRQALLSSDASGNIVITQSIPVTSGITLQRIKNGVNNILSQSWSVKGSDLFNKYVFQGQLDPRASNLSGESDIENIEYQSSSVINQDVRTGRQKVQVEGRGYSSGELAKKAKWALQIDRARATRMSVSVAGHKTPIDTEWAENTLVQINSDTADITRPMLISSITYSQGEGQATITQIELVERDVYTIEDDVISKRKVKKLGKQNNAYWQPQS